MTCIVAKVEDGVVHMAGDKCGSNGYTYSITTRPKVFINNDFIIGYTTSFRMGQLLEFTWSPPEKLPSQSEETYIYKIIVDSIKKSFKEDGFATDKCGGDFLFGYEGKLYHMQSDYAIFEVEDYAAVGCGTDEALAVVYASEKFKFEGSVEELLSIAIEASSANKTGVSSDYNYLSL